MEHQHLPNTAAAEHRIALACSPEELQPDQAQVKHYRVLLADEPESRTAYCLGWLIASLEGIAAGLAAGDARHVMWHLRLGRAAIAAYELTTPPLQETGSQEP